ncbi:MAG TPA: divalent metal cation transporter [Candidatus Dadabacteria bacterium]|jgi:Mn2+/Fe2+ NRAMP family transporter|nr:divalent metal cation transporter [Candidatus Dadabacteria bacterium]
MKKIIKTINKLGPSILWASAAIGVSHIVQSTRAGATYGYILIVAVILANFFKYPFFEFATRYTVVKNETVLDGYKKIGDWAIYLFVGLTLLTMFTIQAGVTRVTAAIFQNWLDLKLNFFSTSLIILLLCGFVIVFVNRKYFDRFVKILILILIISTLISVFLTNQIPVIVSRDFVPPEILSSVGLTFLIALIGWMPSPIDLSAWSSIWIMEKRKNKEDFSFKDNVLDFNLSYIVTSILAIIFLILGANVFYGSGEEFAPSATTFVHQLVQLYASLGDWSKNIILLTALTTMLSTTLTCLDAFPKVLNKSFNIINQDSNEEKNYETIFLVFIILGTLVTIFYIGERMKYLVDLATILSFMTAPFLAYLNYKLIFNIDFPKQYKPTKFLQMLSISGLCFLSFFLVVFILNYFGLIY